MHVWAYTEWCLENTVAVILLGSFEYTFQGSVVFFQGKDSTLFSLPICWEFAFSKKTSFSCNCFSVM